MKKYFTKYLPVEGEIKEGDTVTDGVITYVINDHKWKLLQDPTKLAHLLTKIKKVKLFLCSRDIQIGDSVILESHPDFGEKTVISNDGRVISLSDGSKTHDHNLIKVIGEISPEATWVTEGMEFDKDEISWDFGQNWDRNRPEYAKNPNHKNVHVLQVKGPCGHFH